MRSLLILTVLAACSGDSPAEIDANPAGPTCTKVTYDPCVTEHDCTSGVCRYFSDTMLMVCTQSCDASNPCPKDKNGAAGTCNAMSQCEPAVANHCHVGP